MLSISNQSEKNESFAVSDMISRRVDGIIIVPVTDKIGKAGYSEMLEKSECRLLLLPLTIPHGKLTE